MSYIERTHHFKAATPYPFDRKRGFGGGETFRYEDRTFYSHCQGNHADKNYLTVCPHCQRPNSIKCNGPMFICECGKAFVWIGSELFIEDFDNCPTDGFGCHSQLE